MADRPEADQDGQPASYSPPPQHRPAWIDSSRGDRPASGIPPQNGDWSGGPTGHAHPRPAPGHAPRRRGGTLAVAITAALVASIGTYALLLAGGQLDRQLLISEPLGQQTGTDVQVDPDIVREALRVSHSRLYFWRRWFD